MKNEFVLLAVLVAGGTILSAGEAKAGPLNPQTGTAVSELACARGLFSSGSPVVGGAKTLGCLWNKPVLRFEPRQTPPNYQFLPPLRAPQAQDFRSFLPPFRPLTR